MDFRTLLPIHRFARALVVLALAAYVLLVGALFREDLRVHALGDTLALRRREIDAQLVQNRREMERLDSKKSELMLEVLRDERHALNAQGVQATEEYGAWQVQRTLWRRIYWTGFLLAHLGVIPLLLWSLGFWYPIEKERAGRSLRRGAKSRSPRKRSTKPRAAAKPTELAGETGTRAL